MNTPKKNWEIPGYLESIDNHLHIDGIDVRKLADEFGTPLFVYSKQRIKHNINQLKEVQNKINSKLKICYAAKAMSTLGILRVIKECDSDLEVNSGGELYKALKCGFAGDQIVFNGTSKEEWELELAIKSEIFAIQVDSFYELGLIDRVAKRLNKKARVSLRIVPEIETATHSGLKTALLTSKFGMLKSEVFQAVEVFGKSDNLNICGVHLHIGSQNPDPETFAAALATLFETAAEMIQHKGSKLDHINLGGGFPVDYLKGAEVAHTITRAQAELLSSYYSPSDAINSAYKKAVSFVNDAGFSKEVINYLDKLELLIEPGRFIIADAGTCLTLVRNHKSRPIDKSLQQASHNEDLWLLTDAGFNILLSMETYKWYYHTIAATKADMSHNTKYKVAGPLCDGGDVYFDIEGENRLPDYRFLPAGMKSGDLLAVLNCGAYSLSQASQYNGRPLPAVVLTDDDNKYTLIRRRETLEDLISADL